MNQFEYQAAQRQRQTLAPNQPAPKSPLAGALATANQNLEMQRRHGKRPAGGLAEAMGMTADGSLYNSQALNNQARSTGPRPPSVDESRLQQLISKNQTQRRRGAGTQMNMLPQTQFGAANPGIASNNLAMAKARGMTPNTVTDLYRVGRDDQFTGSPTSDTMFRVGRDDQHSGPTQVMEQAGSRRVDDQGRVHVEGQPLYGAHLPSHLGAMLEGEGYRRAPQRSIADQIRIARSNERIRSAGGSLPGNATLPEALGMGAGTGQAAPVNKLAARLGGGFGGGFAGQNSDTVSDFSGPPSTTPQSPLTQAVTGTGSAAFQAYSGRRDDRREQARQMMTQMAQDERAGKAAAQQQAYAAQSNPLNNPIVQQMMARDPASGASVLRSLLDGGLRQQEMNQQGQQFGANMQSEQSMLAQKLGLERERMGYQSPLDQANAQLAQAQAGEVTAKTDMMNDVDLRKQAQENDRLTLLGDLASTGTPEIQNMVSGPLREALGIGGGSAAAIQPLTPNADGTVDDSAIEELLSRIANAPTFDGDPMQELEAAGVSRDRAERYYLDTMPGPVSQFVFDRFPSGLSRIFGNKALSDRRMERKYRPLGALQKALGITQ